jgi:hypothetical protein
MLCYRERLRYGRKHFVGSVELYINGILANVVHLPYRNVRGADSRDHTVRASTSPLAKMDVGRWVSGRLVQIKTVLAAPGAT